MASHRIVTGERDRLADTVFILANGNACIGNIQERVAGMATNGRDKSGRVRIRCSAAKEGGTCSDGKTFYLDVIEKAVLGGLRTEMRAPKVIAEYIRTYLEEPVARNCMRPETNYGPSLAAFWPYADALSYDPRRSPHGAGRLPDVCRTRLVKELAFLAEQIASREVAATRFSDIRRGSREMMIGISAGSSPMGSFGSALPRHVRGAVASKLHRYT